MEDIYEQFLKQRISYSIIGRAHYLASDRYAALNRALGIPVIVITAVVGTTIFGSIDSNPDSFWKILTGLFSLLGTVLSSLQTSLGFAQSSEKHKAAGEAYRGVKRQFDLLSLKYAKSGPENRESAILDLEKLLSGLTDMAREYPTIPNKFYLKAKKYEKNHEAE